MIGAKGGRSGHTGGFASSHELAVRAGKIGGSRSKRGKAGVRKEKVYVKMWGE